MRKNVCGAKFHAGSECRMPMWQTGCCRAQDCFLEIKDRGASDEASRFLFLNELMECFGGCSLFGGRVGDGSLSRVGDGWLLCSAVSPHRCLPGRGSAVRWPMQRGAMAHAACSVGQCSVLRFQSHCLAGGCACASGFFSALPLKGMLRDGVHRAAFLICCLMLVCRMQKSFAWPASDFIPGNRCASRGCSHWSSPRRGWCRASRPVWLRGALHRRW